jgi:hypothetical protein
MLELAFKRNQVWNHVTRKIVFFQPISFIFNILRDFSRDIHEYLFSADFGKVASHSHAGVLNKLSGGHVVLPAMPGAGNNLILERPLSQGSAPVQAGVIDSEELTSHIGERHGFASNLNFMNSTHWDFSDLRSSHKRHIHSLGE